MVLRGLDLVARKGRHMLPAPGNSRERFPQVFAGLMVKAACAVSQPSILHVTAMKRCRLRHRMRPQVAEHLNARLAIQFGSHLVGDLERIWLNPAHRAEREGYLPVIVSLIAFG